MEISSQILGMIQNIVLIITGVIGSVVGIKGYFAWKVQMEGKDLYSVQKKLMGGLIDYRNALDEFREPFLQFTLQDNENQNDAKVRIYNERQKILVSSRRSLELAIKELAIIKGTEQEQLFEGIWKWYAEAIVAVQMHFRKMQPDHYERTEVSEAECQLREEQFRAMYSKSGKDEFRDSFITKLDTIEDAIRKLQ